MGDYFKFNQSYRKLYRVLIYGLKVQRVWYDEGPGEW